MEGLEEKEEFIIHWMIKAFPEYELEITLASLKDKKEMAITVQGAVDKLIKNRKHRDKVLLKKKQVAEKKAMVKKDTSTKETRQCSSNINEDVDELNRLAESAAKALGQYETSKVTKTQLESSNSSDEEITETVVSNAKSPVLGEWIPTSINNNGSKYMLLRDDKKMTDKDYLETSCSGGGSCR